MSTTAKQMNDAYGAQIARLSEMRDEMQDKAAAVWRDDLSETSQAWQHFLDTEATPDERTAYEAFRKGAQLHRVKGNGAIVPDGSDFLHLSERASELLIAAREIAVPIREMSATYRHRDSLGKVDHVAEMQKPRAAAEKELRSRPSPYFDPKTGRPTQDILKQSRTGRLKGSTKAPEFDKRHGF